MIIEAGYLLFDPDLFNPLNGYIKFFYTDALVAD